MRAPRGTGGRVERPEVVGARQAIVHQRAGAQLAALRVVDRVFVERLAYALDKATVHLALHDERVDDAPEIVGSGEIEQCDRPGISIDFDFGDVRTCGVGEVRRIIKRRLIETASFTTSSSKCSLGP
jgi:hypothetical protein